MRTSSRYIILMGVFISCLSSLYFWSLFVPIPFVITCCLALVSFLVLLRWIVIDKASFPLVEPGTRKVDWILLLILAVGIGIISKIAVAVAPKYGGYDAQGIWNFHAEYLADPAHWRKLFQNTQYSHPDYPLCLPSVIAFFMRLFSTDTVLVPFAFCITILLSIPVLVYQEISRKNLVVAVVTLLLFALERYFITEGVSQQADILVAFFFLCAFICANYMQQDKKYIILSAFFLASCFWAKNEGGILAVIFFGFYYAVFFSRKNIKYTAIGIAVPFFSTVILKLICGVHNDMVSETNASVFSFILQKDRYAAVFNSYISLITENYIYSAIAILGYLAICIFKRMFPNRQMFILLSCLFSYSMIYIITPKNLEWHLRTSHSRLILQLMPATIYVMAAQIAEIPFAIPRWVKIAK